MTSERFVLLSLVIVIGYLIVSAPKASQGDSVTSYDPTIDQPLTDLVDTVSETLASYTGLEIMTSTRYAAALADPKNAGIIDLLRQAEQRYGLPDGLLVRQAWQESRFNPGATNASSGAGGLLQFIPATAAEWNVDRYNAASSADGGARYMAWLYGKTGSWSLALAAYNWGIGNLLKKGIASAPSETQNYVSQIQSDTGLLA